MTTIVKATTKGQITLPVAWRKQFATDHFVVEKTDRTLIIKPLNLSAMPAVGEYTVFDALRDNHGQGIKASALLRCLKKTLS